MIFFDIDNTLLDHDHAMVQGAAVFQQAFAETFPISRQAFTQRWVSLADQAYRHYLQGDLSLQAARIWRMQTLFQSVGASLSPTDARDLAQQAIATYTRHWRLYPDVRPCLERLAGLPLGIISNGHAQQQREKLAAFNLSDYFTVVCISSESGAAKPDAAIFQNAGAQTRSAIGECVYIGDQLDQDARAAAQAGMIGIWLNRKGVVSPPTDLEQISEIYSLNQLQGHPIEKRHPAP
jgi:putative hydrolase of the HAD superfamily